MTNPTAAATPPARIDWVDVAKGIGIALVFHGHLVERFICPDVSAAAFHMRWVYCFHMPMFFLLVGLVYKDRGLTLEEFLKRQFRTRLLPAWIFNILAMIVWLAIEVGRGDAGWVSTNGWAATTRYCGGQLLDMLYQGRYAWNVLTWFLFCLFTAELLQFGLSRLTRRTAHLVACVIGVGLVVTLVHLSSETISTQLGEKRHWWYLTTALAALLFYQIGILIRRLPWLIGERSTLQRVVLCAAFLVVTLVTFDLNEGVRTNSPPVVLMVDAKYGQIGWFLLSSLAGSLFVIYLSQLLAASRVLKYLGTITLGLMGLNGIMHTSLNPALAGLIVKWSPVHNAYVFTAVAVGVTILSLLACIPLVLLLERYLPYAVGRAPRRAGTKARSHGGPCESEP